MGKVGKIARRTFLIGSAAIVGGVAFGVYKIKQEPPNPLVAGDGQAALNPFVFIDQSGVTLIAPRAEMGQGVMNTLAVLIAEELDVDPQAVRVLHGPPAKAYYNSALLGEVLPGAAYNISPFMHSLGEFLGQAGKLMDMQVTGGSTSMRDAFKRLREAGASARETLKLAAAQQLGVDAGQLKTENGTVIAPDGTTLRYEDLAEASAGIEPPNVDLRPSSEWRLLGKTQPRIDMVGKVTGTAEFGIDVRREGMKFAALRANPARAGMVKFDASTAETMPGVDQVVDLGDAIAVVGSNTWLVQQAVDAIDVEWESASYPADTDAIFDTIRAALDDEPNSTMRNDGDVSTLPDGATEVTAEYTLPYLAHAAMEPLNATALHTGSTLEIWCGNQAPTFTRTHCATAVGLDEDRVTVHTTLLGGAFGRRGEMDFSVYAAKLAKAVQGTPVQLTWSREEDMTHDFYRPGAVARMRGAVKDGTAVMLDGQVAGQSCSQQAMSRWLGMGGAGPDKGHVAGLFDQPYAIPNYRIRGHLADMTLPVGFWRSVGASFNAFFHDTFMDEMAIAAGTDPLEFRLRLMEQEHAPSAQVLAAVRDMSGWTGQTPDGIGRGVGFSHSFGTPVAQVIEVADQDGQIAITRAWIAVDPGIALDPGNIEAQMVGGVIYGLSAACFGEITFADGAAEQQNFPDYEALRMRSTPVTEVQILENQPHITGVGEPGTPPAMPALGNAIFDLTGKRARKLPLMHEFDLKL